MHSFRYYFLSTIVQGRCGGFDAYPRYLKVQDSVFYIAILRYAVRVCLR